VLPPEHLLVRFEVVDEDTRRLHLEPYGARAEEIARALSAGAPT
jgi:hypothetical protein